MTRLLVIGASGSGTTTLGQALAEALRVPQRDTDVYFWCPTDPPYTEPRTAEARNAMLLRDLDDDLGWIVSGSITGWRTGIETRLDLAVFLLTPTTIRLARLRAREECRHGSAALAPGGLMHPQHSLLMEWAARYDSADLEQRSRRSHEEYFASLACPVLRLRGDDPTTESARTVTAALSALHGG